jgi:hypothetical protein
MSVDPVPDSQSRFGSKKVKTTPTNQMSRFEDLDVLYIETEARKYLIEVSTV